VEDGVQEVALWAYLVDAEGSLCDAIFAKLPVFLAKESKWQAAVACPLLGQKDVCPLPSPGAMPTMLLA